jgi:hypothetical protein
LHCAPTNGRLSRARAAPAPPPPDLPRAIATGALPSAPRLDPLAAERPVDSAPAPATGDGPRLLR